MNPADDKLPSKKAAEENKAELDQSMSDDEENTR